jgi:LDH2 family malate/lactate/ureidoglycolate dehydrogenase
MAAWYAQRALSHNMIGLTGTNARPSVAPTHGVDAMFGTNPIAFAMPADDECPFVFDAATTIAQRGKVETYARLGKKLPEGWVVGADGQPKTDAAQVLEDLTKYKAALLPLGGLLEESGSHKGFGFASIVEIMSSALQQGEFLRNLSGVQNGQRVPNRIGHFFFAMNLECFGDVREISKTTGDILKQLRASTRRTAEQEIFTAGLKEHRLAIKSERDGVPIDAEVAADLKSLRSQFGLGSYKFPFD